MSGVLCYNPFLRAQPDSRISVSNGNAGLGNVLFNTRRGF